MPGKHKRKPAGPSLAPIPSEMRDRFVRQGPLSAAQLENVVRRFKKPSSSGRWAAS